MTKLLNKPPNCACFNTRRAARKLTQSYERALKPAAIQPTQFSLLAMLAGKSTGDGIPLTVLAGHLGMDRTTLTRNLSLTEKKKWTSSGFSKDRRERLIKLTAAGKTKLKVAMPYWEAAQDDVVRLLGTKGLNDLLVHVERLNAE